MVLLLFVGFMMGLLADSLRAPAYAQIPDPAMQRHQTAHEQQQTNRLLGDILGVLRSQTLQVRIVETDKTKGDRGGKPIRKP
jgi:hypothetical protein